LDTAGACDEPDTGFSDPPSLCSVDASLFVAGVADGCGLISTSGLGGADWPSEVAGDWDAPEDAGFSDPLSFSWASDASERIPIGQTKNRLRIRTMSVGDDLVIARFLLVNVIL
jgi:hypothetical protein